MRWKVNLQKTPLEVPDLRVGKESWSVSCASHPPLSAVSYMTRHHDVLPPDALDWVNPGGFPVIYEADRSTFLFLCHHPLDILTSLALFVGEHSALWVCHGRESAPSFCPGHHGLTFLQTHTHERFCVRFYARSPGSVCLLTWLHVCLFSLSFSEKVALRREGRLRTQQKLLCSSLAPQEAQRSLILETECAHRYFIHKVLFPHFNFFPQLQLTVDVILY